MKKSLITILLIMAANQSVHALPDSELFGSIEDDAYLQQAIADSLNDQSDEDADLQQALADSLLLQSREEEDLQYVLEESLRRPRPESSRATTLEEAWADIEECPICFMSKDEITHAVWNDTCLHPLCTTCKTTLKHSPNPVCHMCRSGE